MYSFENAVRVIFILSMLGIRDKEIALFSVINAQSRIIMKSLRLILMYICYERQNRYFQHGLTCQSMGALLYTYGNKLTFVLFTNLESGPVGTLLCMS